MFALKTLQDKWQAKYGTRYFDSRDVDRRFSTSLYGSDRVGRNCRGKRGRGWLVHRRPIGSGDGLQKHLVATRSKHPGDGWLKWVRLPPPAPRLEPNVAQRTGMLNSKVELWTSWLRPSLSFFLQSRCRFQ